MTTESLPALRGRIRFPDISSRAYEHPADRGALVALRAIPGFDSVLKTISSAIGERSIRYLYLATAIRVSPRQYPHIHQMLNECATTLDLQPVPELYIEQDPTPAAMAIGMGKPIIVVSTGMLDLVDDEGLRFIIGHEVGHVLSGHAVYRTMLICVDQSRCRHGVAADRRVEHPGDHPRSERVVPQVRVVLRSCRPAVFSRPERSVAGARKSWLVRGTPTRWTSRGFSTRQRSTRNSGDVRDSLLKLLQMSGKSHPLAALRAAELQKWAAGPELRRDPGRKLPAPVRR